VSRLLATALLTILGASVVAFGFMYLAPMDPAQFMIGFRQGVRADQVNRLREWYGFDQPKAVQYVRWMTRAVRGEFGTSVTTRREVGPDLARRLPWSLVLVAAAGLLAWALAVPLAVASARGGVLGRASDAVIAVGLVLPTFLIATLLVYVFAVRMVLIPILPPFDLNLLDRSLWVGMILPSLGLGLPMAAVLARQLRLDLAEVLRAPYVTAARAKGASTRRAVWRHAARVATRTLLARPLPALSLLFSGLLLVEEIFNWPGIGRSFTRALVQRDIPVMQAALFLMAVVSVAAELALRLVLGRPGVEPDAYAAASARGSSHGRPSRLAPSGLRARVAIGAAALLAVATIAAPFVVRFPPDQITLDEINALPSLRHWMGTDSSGRDLFSRLLFAGRTTLGISIGAAVVAVLGGVLVTSGVGETAHRRWRRLRLAVVHGAGRVIMAVPVLGLALTVIATAGREPVVIAAVFAAIGLASVGRRMRTLQVQAWGWPFVIAAQAAGAPTLRIGERHLLPHLTRPLLAAAAGLVPGFLILEATMGFLGFSVTPTTPSWGTLLWRSREALHRGDWWLIVFPAAFVALAAWAFTAVSETLDRFQPPTYLPTARLRLGREWERVSAPAGRHLRGQVLPTSRAASRALPMAGGVAAEAASGTDASGGSSA
jgi:peptide/nickel transport system permease protein